MNKTENPRARQRNTKERIRRAAVEEFSAKGYAGARVERIARMAKVNIRMIYYFFGSKKKLLDDVQSEIFFRRKAWLGREFDNLVELAEAYFEGYAGDPESVRLLLWEALETPADSHAKLSNFEERRDIMRHRIEWIRQAQEQGRAAKGLAPELLYLMILGLAVYPMSFPQTVFIATGEKVSSEAFKTRYREFLKQVGKLVLTGGADAPEGDP